MRCEKRICFPPFVPTVRYSNGHFTSHGLPYKVGGKCTQFTMGSFVFYNVWPAWPSRRRVEGRVKRGSKAFSRKHATVSRKTGKKNIFFSFFLLFRETKTRTKQISRNGTVHCRTVYKPTSIFFRTWYIFLPLFYGSVECVQASKKNPPPENTPTVPPSFGYSSLLFRDPPTHKPWSWPFLPPPFHSANDSNSRFPFFSPPAAELRNFSSLRSYLGERCMCVCTRSNFFPAPRRQKTKKMQTGPNVLQQDEGMLIFCFLKKFIIGKSFRKNEKEIVLE